MRLTKDEELQRSKLLQFRAKLEDEIEYLNNELIYTNNDILGSTRDTAREVRDNLVECSNLINKYRLVYSYYHHVQ